MISPFYKKSIISISIYLLLFFALILLILLPTSKKLKQNKILIKEKNATLENNFSKISSLQKVEKNIDEFNKINETVVGYLPPLLQSSQFIVEVEGLTNSLGITIDNFSMNATSSAFDTGSKTKTETKSSDSDLSSSKNNSNQKETKKKNSGTQQNQFTLSVQTDYNKALEFIKQMEKLSRFNSVSSINISSKEDNLINLKIDGYIYYEQ